jgi:uncharacterized phage protein (TIGR01671 family)
MKRVIKFRAWIIFENKMIDVTTIYFDGYGGFEISGENYESLDHLEIILEQFTGLTDKNGVEVYEGDILKADRWWKWNWIVKFDTEKARFNCIINSSGHSDDYIPESVEVIGNIHQNPNLL